MTSDYYLYTVGFRTNCKLKKQKHVWTLYSRRDRYLQETHSLYMLQHDTHDNNTPYRISHTGRGLLQSSEERKGRQKRKVLGVER